MNHHFSDKRQAFYRSVKGYSSIDARQLKEIVAERRIPIRARAAPLRVLTCTAPLEVTQGRPYAERRRLVRKHHNI